MIAIVKKMVRQSFGIVYIWNIGLVALPFLAIGLLYVFRIITDTDVLQLLATAVFRIVIVPFIMTLLALSYYGMVHHKAGWLYGVIFLLSTGYLIWALNLIVQEW